MASTSVVYDILARDHASDKFNRFGNTVDRSSGRLGKFASVAGRAGKAVALGLGSGLVAAGAAAVTFAKGAAEDEQAANLMATAFRNNANATDAQIAAAEDWISLQGKMRGVADDELRPALSRLITATHDVGKAQQLAQLAMDVSAGSGKSLEAVSTALMKAQNGQVSSLSRLGINTKNAAGETISMDEAVQRMATTFGGAAAAKSETLQGKLDRLKVMLSEAGEEIGYRLIPVATRMADFFVSNVVPAFETASAWAEQHVVPALKAIGQWIQSDVIPALQKLGTWIGEHVVPVFQKFSQDGPSTFAKVRDALVPFIAKTREVVTLLAESMRPVIKQLVTTWRQDVVPALGKVADKFREWWPTISKVIDALAEVAAVIISKVLPKLVELVGWIISKGVPGILDFIDPFVKAAGAAVDFGKKVVSVAQDVGQFVRRAKAKFDEVVEFVKDIPGKVVSALGDLGDLLKDAGRALLQGLYDGIVEKWEDVKSLVGGMAGWVKDHKGPLEVDRVLLKPAGQAMMDGLIAGIESRRGKLGEVLLKMGETIAETVKNGWKPFLKEWLADQLAGMRSAIADLRDRRNQFADFSGFRGNLFGADISGGSEGTGPTGLAALRAFAAAERAKAEQAEADIAKLTAMGISQDLLDDLKSQGASGLAQIHALAQASQEEANQIFADMAAANAAYQRAGNEASVRLDETIRQMGAVIADMPRALTAAPLVIELHSTQPDGRVIVRRIHAEERAAGKKYLVDV